MGTNTIQHNAGEREREHTLDLVPLSKKHSLCDFPEQELGLEEVLAVHAKRGHAANDFIGASLS